MQHSHDHNIGLNPIFLINILIYPLNRCSYKLNKNEE